MTKPTYLCFVLRSMKQDRFQESRLKSQDRAWQPKWVRLINSATPLLPHSPPTVPFLAPTDRSQVPPPVIYLSSLCVCPSLAAAMGVLQVVLAHLLANATTAIFFGGLWANFVLWREYFTTYAYVMNKFVCPEQVSSQM